MRTLLVIAVLFFALFGGAIAYLGTSDPGHEYDLNFVLPIDTRQIPRPTAPSLGEPASDAAPVVSGAAPAAGRAEAGSVPQVPERPLVQLGNGPGVASEVRGGQQ